VNMAPPALQGNLVQADPLVPLERMGVKGLLAKLVSMAGKDLMVLLVLRALQVLKVRQVLKVPLGKLVHTGLLEEQVLKVLKDFMGVVEILDPRVPVGLQVQLGRQGNLVPMVVLVQRVKPVHQDLLGLLGKPAIKVVLVLQDPRVQMVDQGLRVVQVTPVFKVLRATTEILGLLAVWVQLAQMVKVCLELPDRMVPLAHRVLRARIKLEW